MMKEKMPQILAWVAVIAALGASVMLLFLPVYTGSTTSSIDVNTGIATGQPVAISATLIDVNGYGALIPLAIPPVLAGLGLLALLWAKRWRNLFMWITAFLLAVFVLISGFSIGMFYVPAMILLMTSAIVTQLRGDTMSIITITKKQ